jgi:hypothetical protein
MCRKVKKHQTPKTTKLKKNVKNQKSMSKKRVKTTFFQNPKILNLKTKKVVTIIFRYLTTRYHLMTLGFR